jgi:hypothetical protein
VASSPAASAAPEATRRSAANAAAIVAGRGGQRMPWRFIGAAVAPATPRPCARRAGAAADDPAREVVHRQHEQDAEPEQPAVGRDDLGEHRNAVHRALAELHQVLEVVLREHEQDAADDGAVDRSHAADDDDQQHVEHDLERERRVGPL